MTSIGLIGGSGFYETTESEKEQIVKTPFGKVKVRLANYNGTEVAFITRHGKDHSIPPHLVNYKANIYALYSLGVNKIVTTSAVGSLEPHNKPGSFVLPNQFIDFTIGRPKTFFDGEFKITLHSGKVLSGVVHTDMTSPYCSALRELLLKNANEMKLEIADKGTYVCTEGPRFETPAEINAFKILGGSIVGMTSVSECILARELGVCYATVCLITNFAAGMQNRITTEEVFTTFRSKIGTLREMLSKTINTISDSPEIACDC